MPLFSVATYNVHQWIGSDGHYDQQRVLTVIRELEAQIVALQEVTYPGNSSWESGQAALSLATEMNAVSGPTLVRRVDHFGNVLLSSYPVLRVSRWDLTVAGREPRGALDVVINVEGARVRVIATHLGRREAERRLQVNRLLELLESHVENPVILMGDFNLWLPGSSLSGMIHDIMGESPALRTYPSRYPTLRLDRVWIRPAVALINVQVHKSALARLASDHLPLRATIRLSIPR